MLDNETKRRINSLRNILVGKLPDPKAQVEQITNGLIYKFMNDMDDESVSMGGKATYFSGKFKKYSWKYLMDTKTSGIEKVSLYSEAIKEMYNNENLPELFREVFKGSFLPFQDPATLNMFLKEINEFNYSNSEKLGDAYEYLLSFMGSQGDAGQFRTPRHIIDLIVEIVNPKKNERILDPACGTAGFLISSYKHILKQNTKKNLGDNLSASDRKKIGKNLNGYDISPDMVKMSLVNMYLHKFTNPKIDEYDTLSSEDNWNEYYDVILANPPFFSPKGGVMPHNKFGVKSTKAEILFVDYIIEHLKPKGRAGIIVPEGIIFHPGKAYKQLRRKLIDNSLIGVISLPAGIFNPYSNATTSILILDKEKSKKNDIIFFSFIENDGFDLGAQRRPIEENDIPKIRNQLIKFITKQNYKIDNDKVFLIKKDLILKKEDNSLKYSFYKKNEKIISKFELLELNELIEIEYGNRIVRKNSKNGDIPVYGGGGKTFNTNEYNRENELIISRFGISEKCVRFIKDKFYLNDSGFSLKIKNNKLNKKYLNNLLLKIQTRIYECSRGVGQKNLDIKEFLKIKLPMPPLEMQSQISEELDNYQKIIDGCRQVKTNYKPMFETNSNWENLKLKDLAKLNYGLNEGALDKGKYRYIRITDINEQGYLKDTNKKYINISKKEQKYILKNEDILIARTGATYGKCLYFENKEPSVYASYLIKIKLDESKILPKYFWIFTQSELFNQQKLKLVTGTGQPQFNANTLEEVIVPIPSIDEQKKIIKNVKEQQNLIFGNTLLIKEFEKKISEKILTIFSS